MVRPLDTELDECEVELPPMRDGLGEVEKVLLLEAEKDWRVEEQDDGEAT